MDKLNHKHHLRVMTKEIAEKYSKQLAELANQIPLVDYSQNEILS